MDFQRLISLPPAMAEYFPITDEGRPWFAACDPPGGKLGSGGGVAHLLASAWRASGTGQLFEEWCDSGLKLSLMAGGQSRRLPAYAATGKILMPFPALRWGDGQRLDQTLLDIQLPGYRQIADAAPSSSRVMVASGDVLLRFPLKLPAMPEADVIGLGMWVDAATASHFGVFFTRRESPEKLAFFLQKPESPEISRLAADHLFLVDTGLWLLSARAVSVLFKKCGWDTKRQDFKNSAPDFHELYAGMGPCLGSDPAEYDDDVSSLTCAVVPLPEAEFYHFGTSRQMIESVSALQNRTLDQLAQSPLPLKPHPDMYVLNSEFTFATRSPENKPVWVENCTLSDDMVLSSGNVLTNIPAGIGAFQVPVGTCIDTPPIGVSGFAIRVYGIDDSFKGAIGNAGTLFLGAPVTEWLTRRGLLNEECGIPGTVDIQNARLFPVLEPDAPIARIIEWMTLANPPTDSTLATLWLESERLSAQEITERFSPSRLLQTRRSNISAATPRFFKHRHRNAFPRLDLENAAGFYAMGSAPLPQLVPAQSLESVSESMFSARIAFHRGDTTSADSYEGEAFKNLSKILTSSNSASPVAPHCSAVEDQIIWGRSPIRVDLAGGWTDTPPYCLKHGGAVVNVALELNGQPPIQVFARATKERHLVIRSIDLGAETHIRSFVELEDFTKVGAEFSLAKAALALAGFHPRFSSHTSSRTLEDLLKAFGGGLELSMLAATPKGSGLGTSSILSATILGTLSDVCGLAWDRDAITARTLVLEQLLTTGGGWQDQAGGLHRGLKMIESMPGLVQQTHIRWLPEHMLQEAIANGTALLYYTGITRVAKSILQDIVRGMFLNRSNTLSLLNEIHSHARDSFDNLQRASWSDLCSIVRRSWDLNCTLDSGTNPPAVQEILSRVSDWTAAAKLPGAGGGGYLLLLAKDPGAAARIRHELVSNPPNPRSRFVRMSISTTGLQVTRS